MRSIFYPTKQHVQAEIVAWRHEEGKAAKSVSNAFTTQQSDETERDLIKSLPEQNYIHEILAKVKIMNARTEQGKSNRGGRGKKCLSICKISTTSENIILMLPDYVKIMSLCVQTYTLIVVIFQ